MGLMSPGGENLLDFLELRQVLSTYDGDLRDPLWWVRKEFPAFPSHLKRRRSPQERREELQGRAPIP